MSFCDEHGTADYCGECVYGPEIERLTAERDAAQAEARELKQRIDIMLCQACHDRCNTPPTGLFHSPDPEEEPCIICWLEQQSDETVKHAERADKAEAEARELRTELARVREIVSGMREYADSCDHPSEASKRNAVEYWLAQLEGAISQPAEQHDPLAVSDHCGECSEPEPECVCGEQPDERESLPLTFTQGVLCSLSILDRYGDSIAYREVTDPHDLNQLWEEADEFDREHLVRHGYRPTPAAQESDQ